MDDGAMNEAEGSAHCQASRALRAQWRVGYTGRGQ